MKGPTCANRSRSRAARKAPVRAATASILRTAAGPWAAAARPHRRRHDTRARHAGRRACPGRVLAATWRGSTLDNRDSESSNPQACRCA
eukprot:CAMPEP_0119290330 /NCGR_PEP_ID=MMETSP1329-20130426/40516_1 /TAXON_ID=114041 /ORGANISM="Genus nov. species nov., Strain RCC1024" /LENGTH=88 /DNA_ID=CAMNT_0007291149 /DNA_START=161 /DNA_END=423 /DNA_ORIENTATION=-